LQGSAIPEIILIQPCRWRNLLKNREEICLFKEEEVTHGASPRFGRHESWERKKGASPGLTPAEVEKRGFLKRKFLLKINREARHLPGQRRSRLFIRACGCPDESQDTYTYHENCQVFHTPLPLEVMLTCTIIAGGRFKAPTAYLSLD
jgi:hypothetical protein